MTADSSHQSLLGCLFPGSVAAFRAAYPGKPFHVAEATSRFPAFVRELSLDWMCENYRDPLDVHSNNSRPVTVNAANRDAVLWLLEHSAGITFAGIERFVPGLQAWCTALAAELELPPHCARPRCNAFASPRSAGYQFHFHYEGALLIQLAGCKNVRVAPVPGGAPVIQTDANQAFEEGFGSEERPMAAHAQFAKTGFPAPPSEPETAGFDLGPGSALYIPPGHWHATRSEDERSFAFNMFISTPRWYEILLRALELALLTDPAWREPVAPGAMPGARLEALQVRLAEAVAALRTEDLLLCLGKSPALAEQSTLCPNPDVRWSIESSIDHGVSRLRLRSRDDYSIDIASDMAAAVRSLLEHTVPYSVAAARRSMSSETAADLVPAIELLQSIGALVRGPFPT